MSMTNSATAAAEAAIIHGQSSRADRVLAEMEAQEKALYRPDGEPIYGPAEHRDRLALIRQGAIAQLEGAKEEIAKVVERARQTALLAHNDPADDLTPAELERAAGMAPFVREDLQGMALAELRNRLQAVQTYGSRPLQWVYARYAQREAARLEEQRRALVGRSTRSQDAQAEERALIARGELLSEAAKALWAKAASPERLRKIAEAQGTQAKAEQAIRAIDRHLMKARMAGSESRSVVNTKAVF